MKDEPRLVSVSRRGDAPSHVGPESHLTDVDFGAGPTWPIYLTPLGEGKYRVEDVFDLVLGEYSDEEPIEELHYHDVIEGEEIGNGRLRFIRVAQRSGLENLHYFTSRDLYLPTEMRSLWKWLSDQGGASQLEMGGFLSVSIPKAAEARFSSEFDRIAEQYKRAKPATDASQAN